MSKIHAINSRCTVYRQTNSEIVEYRKDSSAFFTGSLYFIQNKRSFVGYAGKFAAESFF
jgi:hypothetical protein